jgi:hypothetical protein
MADLQVGHPGAAALKVTQGALAAQRCGAGVQAPPE